jgi:hypothetical protein
MVPSGTGQDTVALQLINAKFDMTLVGDRVLTDGRHPTFSPHRAPPL